MENEKNILHKLEIVAKALNEWQDVGHWEGRMNYKLLGRNKHAGKIKSPPH